MNEETKAVTLALLKSLRDWAHEDMDLVYEDVGIGISNWWVDNKVKVAESIRRLEEEV